MDFSNIFGKVKEMQERMKAAQETLATIQATAEAGGGMVKATVNGKKQLVRLDIDPDLVKPEDRDMLQDLIVAAVNKAITDIEEKSKEHLMKATEGMIPPGFNIPGFDFKF